MVCKMIITVLATVFLLSSSLALPVEGENPVQKEKEEPEPETVVSEQPPESSSEPPQVLQESTPAAEVPAVVNVLASSKPEDLAARSRPDGVPASSGVDSVPASLKSNGAPAALGPYGATGPQVLAAGNVVISQGIPNAQAKSDLDTANTFWGGYYGYRPYWGGYGGGWRRGWGGYGGGYGGYGRGFGGYGGWGWGGGWGGRRYYWG